MLNTIESKSGQKTVSINGVLLHSAYDPEKEARRFVTEAIGKKSPALIFLLGAGIGYVGKALKERFPEAKLICMYYSTPLYEQSFCRGEINWHPQAGTDVADFLYARLSEPDLEGLEYIEWPPCGKSFSKLSGQVHKALHQVIRELNGSVVTTAGAGRLWIKNTFYNFLHLDNIMGGSPCTKTLPIVIMASGPSLEQSYPLVKKHRSNFSLWALPSALGYCRQHDILPDLVVVTDPGYYSAYHFYGSGLRRLRLAMPLSACRGLWTIQDSVFLFAQDTFFERAVLASLGHRLPLVPSNGTVAGSALLLALAYSVQPVVLLGLDMCFKDVFSHARPAAFQELLYHSSLRTAPFLGGLYDRVVGTAPPKGKNTTYRTSSAYATYAGWFSRLPAETRKRIFRVHPSPVDLPGIGSMDEIQLAKHFWPRHNKSAHNPSIPLRPYPAFRQRKTILASVLRNWLDSLNQELPAPFPLRQPLVRELLYFICTQKLLEYKRCLRLEGPDRAKTLSGSLIRETADFLRRLKRKITAEDTA